MYDIDNSLTPKPLYPGEADTSQTREVGMRSNFAAAYGPAEQDQADAARWRAFIPLMLKSVRGEQLTEAEQKMEDVMKAQADAGDGMPPTYEAFCLLTDIGRGAA